MSKHAKQLHRNSSRAQENFLLCSGFLLGNARQPKERRVPEEWKTELMFKYTNPKNSSSFFFKTGDLFPFLWRKEPTLLIYILFKCWTEQFSCLLHSSRKSVTQAQSLPMFISCEWCTCLFEHFMCWMLSEKKIQHDFFFFLLKSTFKTYFSEIM